MKPDPTQPRPSQPVGAATWRKPKVALPKMPGLFRPTTAHLALWARKHAPSWATAHSLSLPIAGLDVDSLINARAGITWSTRVHNALSLAQLARKNCQTGAQKGTFIEYLRQYKGGAGSNDRDRAPIYARWVRGYDKAQAARDAGS